MSKKLNVHDDKSVVAKPSEVRTITSSAEFINLLNKLGQKTEIGATPARALAEATPA